MGMPDWIIVGMFIILILGLGFFIGRAQKNQVDYYLGGRNISSWLVGASLMSNQVSAISLIGAPAFIALKNNGGLRWLQYEMAIPLAMIVIILSLVPVYREKGGITIYEYLERRFGAASRACISGIFLVSRSMGAGVILLATSYVTSVCIGLPLSPTIMLIGLVSLVYTTLGGIRADIITDLIQLIILWVGSLACIAVLIGLMGGLPEISSDIEGRFMVFDLSSTGFGDGNTFSFWPMLFGGFFLYVSYYGCDQSQAQRLLTTRDTAGARKALVINGILRFPLVCTYCCIGVLMIPFISRFPDFSRVIKSLPPDYLIPVFLITYVPEGLLGIIVAGILAASMSSLDSTINSLSAATWQDFLCRFRPGLRALNDRMKVRYSRCITLLWGILSTGFALHIAGVPDTVIELVNKIGSAFYGPVAGIFALGIFSKRTRQVFALGGLAAGVTVNLSLWIFFEREVSWMWWNLLGFLATFMTGFIGTVVRQISGHGVRTTGAVIAREKTPAAYIAVLAAWFLCIITVCALMEAYLTGNGG